MTSAAEVVEEQEVARVEPARLAVGCLEFELALAEHAELALRSGMEISEPVLGPAEEDDSGGGERIGDCDWRSGRRERGKFEFHVHVLEVRLSVDPVVDANIAQRLRSRGVPAHAPTIPTVSPKPTPWAGGRSPVIFASAGPHGRTRAWRQVQRAGLRSGCRGGRGTANRVYAGVLAVHQRVNRQVRLKSRPPGIPQAEHFEIVEVPVPDPSDGQVVVRNIYLSVDPAMRGWVSAVANYSEPVALGAVMRSLAVGRVEESRSSDFHAGEYVTGMFGWQDYAVVDAEAIEREVGGSGLPISTSLGVLGLNGLTAYFALLEIGQPKAGETAVVSTAAGAVGSCVGQIAKIKGCRTVGIAGGPDKVRVCREEFGYDSAVDYRAADFESALDAACPEGVDVYFDNTAGPISDSVMRRLNVGARVVICGTASIASWDPPPQGPRVERHLLVKRARLQGFLIFDHIQRRREALQELENWVRNGQIRYREDILDGIEQAPGSIAGLYRGENLGKRLIRIAPDLPV